VTVAALFLLCLAVLATGYRVYGGLLARRFALDARAATPAHRFEDGNDYVPIPRWYLLGQHFSAISAAYPIVRPIQAAIHFGWLPALLWIVLGSVFIGAMHDFSALVGSVRHRAQSVAEIVREHMSQTAFVLFLAFVWLALVYVIVAFADITASSFVTGTEELATAGATFHAGGAVAAASTHDDSCSSWRTLSCTRARNAACEARPYSGLTPLSSDAPLARTSTLAAADSTVGSIDNELVVCDASP